MISFKIAYGRFLQADDADYTWGYERVIGSVTFSSDDVFTATVIHRERDTSCRTQLLSDIAATDLNHNRQLVSTNLTRVIEFSGLFLQGQPLLLSERQLRDTYLTPLTLCNMTKERNAEHAAAIFSADKGVTKAKGLGSLKALMKATRDELISKRKDS